MKVSQCLDDGFVTNADSLDIAARTRGRLRSAAERHKPLRHWLGEKPVLKRSVITDTGDANNVVPEVQGWLIKQQPVQSLVNKRAGVKRKRAGSNSVPPRTANKRRATGEEEEDEYAGWEDETEASAIVAQYSPGGSTEQEHVRRKLRLTRRMWEPSNIVLIQRYRLHQSDGSRQGHQERKLRLSKNLWRRGVLCGRSVTYPCQSRKGF